MKNDYHKRLARTESIANAQRAKLISAMQDAYERSRAECDTESAADYARKIREKLLAESDWTQVVDSPLSELDKLKWAAYRQELRDIPEKSGFPLIIEWPVAP